MSKSFRRFHLTAAPLALATTLASAPSLAQDSIVLDPIILSGGFSPVEATAYGRAATVLTAEEMEQRGVTSVQDALRGLPGVSVSSSGASRTSVRIRGGESRHTLILIDGVNATGGDEAYNLSGLDLADIERIEVLRGPQSVYYGSDAASGVINIITRKADRTGGYAKVEVGNGVALSFGHAVVADRWRLQADLGFREDDGYDHSVADTGDKDGTRRATMGFSGEWSASDDLKLGFSSRHSEERYWYDEWNPAATSAKDYLRDADSWADRDERINLLWGEFTSLDGRLTHRLSWQDTVNEVTTHDDNPSESKLRRRAWKYRATYGLDGAVASADQTLALSLERITDRTTGEADRRWDTDAVALEYRGAYANGLDVQFGVRHDDNTRFGTNTNWNAGVSWRIEGTPWRLHASAGTGLTYPEYGSILGWPAAGGFPPTIGNPDLQPEENRSVDLGIEYTLPDGRGILDLTWFRERLEDKIEWSPTLLPNDTNFQNLLGTSRREGLEISYRHNIADNLTIGAAYTYLDATNPDGSVAIRRPRHELTLNAALQTFGGRGWVAADLRHVRDLADTQSWGAYETTNLPNFTTVNLAASYDLTDSARLTGRITNLFDKDYSEVWGYAAPGRAAWVGVETRW